MGLFTRKERSGDVFWRTPPVRTRDPQQLRQAGIDAHVAGDGRIMMKAGWALWDVGPLHENQSADLLTDGLKQWRAQGASASEVVAFLRDCLARLTTGGPGAPADLRTAPPSLVAAAAEHQSTRCYMATELALLLADTDPVESTRTEEAVYRAITSCRVEFVPPRSMAWAQACAERHGLPAPWPSS